jgi:hypothetical protein
VGIGPYDILFRDLQIRAFCAEELFEFGEGAFGEAITGKHNYSAILGKNQCVATI